jgi:hypothetical protein
MLLTKSKTGEDWLLSHNTWQLWMIRHKDVVTTVQAQAHQVSINGTQYLRERELGMAHTQSDLAEFNPETKYVFFQLLVKNFPIAVSPEQPA